MTNTPLKRLSLLFWQAVLVLIGIGTLVFLLWEPQVEGRNASATLFQIYFNDLFLAYVYIASIPFFVALYQGITLLRDMRQNNAFSLKSLRTARTMRYCAVTLLASIVGAEAYIFMAQSGKDDIAGGVVMGVFAALISIVIATAATLAESQVQRGLERKSEGDLKA